MAMRLIHNVALGGWFSNCIRKPISFYFKLRISSQWNSVSDTTRKACFDLKTKQECRMSQVAVWIWGVTQSSQVSVGSISTQGQLTGAGAFDCIKLPYCIVYLTRTTQYLLLKLIFIYTPRTVVISDPHFDVITRLCFLSYHGPVLYVQTFQSYDN